jgi:hypothetical protein
LVWYIVETEVIRAVGMENAVFWDLREYDLAEFKQGF